MLFCIYYTRERCYSGSAEERLYMPPCPAKSEIVCPSHPPTALFSTHVLQIGASNEEEAAQPLV